MAWWNHVLQFRGATPFTIRRLCNVYDQEKLASVYGYYRCLPDWLLNAIPDGTIAWFETRRTNGGKRAGKQHFEHRHSSSV